MSQFKVAAMGGTFDIIHKGHRTLLEGAFLVSDKVIIGLTSDELAKKKGKRLLHDYSQRLDALEKFLKQRFQSKSWEIKKLDNDFGPAAIEGDVEALVASDETSYQGEVLNKLRAERNLGPVETITIPMALASDGKRISTTRIRNSEIDSEGNAL